MSWSESARIASGIARRKRGFHRKRKMFDMMAKHAKVGSRRREWAADKSMAFKRAEKGLGGTFKSVMKRGRRKS